MLNNKYNKKRRNQQAKDKWQAVWRCESYDGGHEWLFPQNVKCLGEKVNKRMKWK